MSTFTTKIVAPVALTALVAGICAALVTVFWPLAVILGIAYAFAGMGWVAEQRGALPTSKAQAIGKFEDFITGQPIKRKQHIRCLVRTRELEAWHAEYDSKHDDYGAELVRKTDEKGITRVYDSLGNCVKVEPPKRMKMNYEEAWRGGVGIGATGATGPATPYRTRATGATGAAAASYQCESCKRFNIGPAEMMTLNRNNVATRCGRCREQFGYGVRPVQAIMAGTIALPPILTDATGMEFQMQGGKLIPLGKGATVTYIGPDDTPFDSPSFEGHEPAQGFR